METIIEINGSIIRTVPAIHYRAVFAREVNQICSCEETRPDAIAVELGPHMVREITAWMKELGIGTSRDIMLPCMLGILVKNRLIHPDFREAAMNLQKHFVKPLNNIPPVLKKQLLHYSDEYLIGLSPTDSLIEAIRCAIELNIPVYGVDMDEFSIKPGNRLLIEEPSVSSFNLTQYVLRYGVMASMVRDPYVDGRRELVMAARLKCIAGIHKRILFTGGLAHWEMIKMLMKDSSVRPADFLIPDLSLNCLRVIVHPRMAVTFMDSYPVITTIYERNRHNPAATDDHIFPLPETGRLYLDIIRKVYTEYSGNGKTDLSESKKDSEILRFADFMRLVDNMQLVHQRSAPPMADLLDSSRLLMPTGFSGLLISELMNIGRPWASPEQFPDIPLICQIPNKSEGGDIKIPFDLFELTDCGKNKWILLNINYHGDLHMIMMIYILMICLLILCFTGMQPDAVPLRLT